MKKISLSRPKLESVSKLFIIACTNIFQARFGAPAICDYRSKSQHRAARKQARKRIGQMRAPSSKKCLTLLAAAYLPAFCAGAITADQVRTLPLPELASRVLGESGAIMIDVDRPHSNNLSSQSLRFYSRATAPFSQYGLCTASRVSVEFDAKQNISSLSADHRYGVAGDVYRSAWTREDFEKLCRGVTSTREFFPAPDARTALDVSLYVDAIARKGPFARQNFSYDCISRCAPDRGDLKWLALNKIDAVRSIDCPKPAKDGICIEITVGSQTIGLFPKVFDIYGKIGYKSVVVSRVAVAVGDTVQ